MGKKQDTFGKTKASNTDFSLESRDVQLSAEYIKNQELRNKLHEQEIKLLSKKGRITADDEKRLGRIQATYAKTVQKAAELHAIAKQLDSTQDGIKRNVESQVDSWGSLSEIYKHSKEELQEIALKSVRLKDVSSSIASNEGLTVKQRQSGLNQIAKFSDGMSSISTKAAELAGLTAEDVDKRAILKSRINDEIGMYQQQLANMQKAGSLDAASLAILQETIQGKKDELSVADKISSQSKLQKQVQEELHESLEGIQKTLLKIRSGVSMLFSGWQGALSLLAFGAGEIAEHFGELSKEMGVGLTQMLGLKSEALLLGAILGDTAKEAVVELGKELGDNRHVTFGMAQDAALLAANYHLSGEQAAFMTTAFGELSGKSEETGNNTRAFVKELSMANGVAPAQVMGDIAQNTEFFALYSKDGGKNIGEAAVAAAKLGVGLGTAAKVADHLLDYQSSVQDEMEASVLLGRDMNLSKARELAYNGDIAGAMKETLEAAGGIESFNKMDIYQKQAVAKAMGVSVGELQKMAAHQESLNGMNGVGEQIYSRTSEWIQSMGNTLSGTVLKGMGGLIIGAGELNKGLGAMGTSIGGMARGTKQMLKNLFAMLAPTKILSKLKQFGGAIANTKVGSAIGGVAGTAKDYIAGKAGGLKDKLMDKVDFKGKTSEIADSAAGAATKTEGIAGKVEKEGGNGEGFKKKAQNIADGVKAFADGKVFVGALGLMAAAAGFVVMLAGIPGMIAVAGLGTLAGEGLMGLAIGLEMIGDIAATGLPFLGVALIAAFGVSLIPLTYALSLLAPLVVSVGTAISTVFAGMASAFVTISTALPTLAANFLPLIAMILPIFGLAAAIGALSLSLLMLGTMGLVALPVLAALGAVGGMAMNLFGGEGGSSNDEMITILKSIDSKVGGTPAINMDSKRITTASNDGAARRGDSGGTKY